MMPKPKCIEERKMGQVGKDGDEAVKRISLGEFSAAVSLLMSALRRIHRTVCLILHLFSQRLSYCHVNLQKNMFFQLCAVCKFG